MSTPINRALLLGYSIPQILQFLQSAMPGLKSKIKRATNAGHSIDQILNILNQGMGGKPGDVRTESQIHAQRDQEQGSKVKALLGLGASALGGTALTKVLPAFANSLKGSLGPSSAMGAEAVEEVLQPDTAVSSSPSPGSSVSPPPAPLPPASQAQLPEIPTNKAPQEISKSPAQQPPQFDSVGIIRSMGLEPKINNLLKAGNTPEQISATVIAGLTPKEKKLFSEQVRAGKATDMRRMVKDYIESPNRAKIAPQTEESRQNLAKGDLVANPEGVLGEIASSRNGQALIKDDEGKLHKIKADEIIDSPLSKKDLAELHDELVRGIEKESGEEVSRNVDWAGYDPKSNSLAYLPHAGSLYIYDDISPEDAKELTNILNVRKTTGENFIGAWKAGSKSPIGAAMSALIRKLQSERGGKGNEYSGKYEKVYDYLEGGKVASRKKYLEGKKKNKAKK